MQLGGIISKLGQRDLDVGVGTVPERHRSIDTCDPGPEGQFHRSTRGSTRPRTWGTAATATGGQGSHDQQQDAHHREFYHKAARPTYREKMLHCLALLWNCSFNK